MIVVMPCDVTSLSACVSTFVGGCGVCWGEGNSSIIMGTIIIHDTYVIVVLPNRHSWMNVARLCPDT